MNPKNKFGFAPVESEPAASRGRKPGPMGRAVRETAETLQESTEAKMEQRRRNAEDAKAWRIASEEGRVLAALPIATVRTDALPRDRLELEAIAQSDEMEELKSSIRERGQKEPIEVWLEGEQYQLKKGWRRLTALTQLLRETGDDRFGIVMARVETGREDRLGRYIDMVEENVIREDLTFAEMAQIAIEAASDGAIEEIDPDAMVGRLYSSLHKTKRSYIRSFVQLLAVLGEALPFPRSIGRNLGVDVARAMRHPASIDALRERLAEIRTAEAQNKVLQDFVTATKRVDGKASSVKTPKVEFHVGGLKVTARSGECRIVSDADYAEIPRERLERAIQAFDEELRRKVRAQ